jgi:hypothetical protein
LPYLFNGSIYVVLCNWIVHKRRIKIVATRAFSFPKLKENLYVFLTLSLSR